MNKNFTLASILLTGIILNTGCAKKVTPIIPIIPNPQNNTPIYHEPISQTSVIIPNPIPQQIETEQTYVNTPTIEYEEHLIPIQEEPVMVEETFKTYPSQIERSIQPINNIEESIESSHPSLSTSNSSGYQLPTIQGQSLSVNEQRTGLNFPQYQGKIILLQIFGKDCEFCFKEMPIIQKIQRKYQGKLQIIAIQGQERMSPATSSRLIQKYDMNYPIVERDDAKNLLSYIGTTYNWTGVLPFIQIIKDGSTEATFSDGGVSFSELSEVIGGL
jgi:thiol-disulfide isomerase/thioredoxin